MEILLNTLILISPIPLILFISLYFRRNWKSTREGKAIMVQKWVFLTASIYMIFNLFNPNYEGKIIAGLIILALINFVFWLMLYNLYIAGNPKNLTEEEDNE